MARHLGNPQPRTIFPIRPRRLQKTGGGFVFKVGFPRDLVGLFPPHAHAHPPCYLPWAKSLIRWNNHPSPVFRDRMVEFVIFKRRRIFCWQVLDRNGKLIATGREKTRPAARYRAYRALFMALSTGWKATDLQPS